MERSQRHAAKIFAIAYLLSFVVIMVAFSRYYAPHLVWDSGEDTAQHFINHEHDIRVYLAGAFFYGAATLVTLTALYAILRPVNRGLALFAAFGKLIWVLFWFVMMLDVFGALRLLSGVGSLQGFGADGLAALAGNQLASGRDAYYIGLAFNGLGTALFACAFFHSRYVPRLLSLWGVLACLYEGACGFLYLLKPSFATILSPDWYELPAMTFEFLLSLWLLFRGLRLRLPGASPDHVNPPQYVSR